MRKALIESYIDQLRASYGKVRMPIEEERLRSLYDEQEYGAMVYQIKTMLNLSYPIVLGLVNKGGPPNALAWIETLGDYPRLWERMFRKVSITMYLRKSFLAEGTFETAVLAMAHELCHVVLRSTWHVLRDQEEAVDLTAMLLGFRDFYVTGCRTVRMAKPSRFEYFVGIERRDISTVGYLTPEEVSYAAEYMTYG